MAAAGLAQRIDAVRSFNRFYTQQIGVLNEGLLRSPFSLAEARVLYELAHRERPTAAGLARALGLDAGYLSRILRGFARRGLIGRMAAPADARQSQLSLTRPGRRAFAQLNARSHAEIGALLARVPPGEQARLVEAMHTVAALLGPPQEPKVPYLLRPHRPGDMGWIIQRHAILYAQEYGWDEQFEALVAEIGAKIIQRFDPKRERCWMAEREGETVGSVCLVQHSATVAQLRLLIVEPKARGLGIGKRLVAECIRFARDAGYRKVVLWTNNVLLAARHLYVEAGFTLVREEPHHSFGKDLVGETWELKL